MKNSIDHFIEGFNHIRTWFGYNNLDRDKGQIKITIEFPTTQQKYYADMSMRRDLEDKYCGLFSHMPACVGSNTLMGIAFEFTSAEKLHTQQRARDIELIADHIKTTVGLSMYGTRSMKDHAKNLAAAFERLQKS